MNKVVVRLRASELPHMLRGDIAGDHVVEVTVEDMSGSTTMAQDAKPDRIDIDQILARRPRNLGTTTEEAVARIRALRDEWED